MKPPTAVCGNRSVKQVTEKRPSLSIRTKRFASALLYSDSRTPANLSGGMIPSLEQLRRTSLAVWSGMNVELIENSINDLDDPVALGAGCIGDAVATNPFSGTH